MTPPLHGLKLVATMPPQGWFGGVDYNFAVEMADELEVLGASVFRLDVASLVTRNQVYAKQAVEALRSFRPDVAISLPNALYILLCKTAGDRNIFRDVLRIPTLMLWDHGLLQLPRQILQHLPATPAESVGGAVRRMRRVLDHPLYLHYSPDRGHIEALDRFGIVEASKVRFFLQPAYPNFVRHGYRTPPSGAFRTPLAFAGNVYLKAAGSLPFRGQPVLGEIEERVLAAKRNSLTECLWDLLMREIGALGRASRNQLRLEPNQTFFWNYMHEEIEMAGNTDVRLHVLTNLNHEYEFFGNFVEPAAVATLRDRYRIRFRKCLDYFTELPLLFMNSDLIVDVINLGYNSGISPKVMGCFACGGMVLFDHKDDFAKTMGGAGSEVMYRSVDHLNAMIEEYLANPRKRKDVSRYLQHRVATEFTFGALAKRILVDEPAWRS